MAMDSEGSTGDLLCIWDPEVLQLPECCCNRKFIVILILGERRGCSRRDKEMKELNDFIDKHEALKLALKQWSREVFRNVHKLKQAEEELHDLDLLAKGMDINAMEKARRREVRLKVGRLSRMVKWIWLQKSRLNWALKGDKNTRFFHIMSRSRQNRNDINSVKVRDVVLDDPSEVNSRVYNHFKNHFLESWKSRPKLGGQFKSVRRSPAFNKLEAALSEEEIKAIVFECDGNKAPGLDGFNLAYF
ncbi:uncharacterized protein LOC114281174 [Camellia sinensis]|uniref:uncharacterized protein LOC114281174 n=1 Tax=Camellia sinensis TaxID=4442 RepID=UPI001035A91F|nr:uncharacterized protein LOC114281174 [Camellia sinensis]